MHSPGSAADACEGYRHEALIYDSDEELLDVVVPFLQEGVRAGEPTLLRLPEPRQAAVLDALDDPDGVTSLPQATTSTPLTALRTAHALVEDLSAECSRPVRVVRSVPTPSWSCWAWYEAAVNLILRPLPVRGICPYDRREVSADVLTDVERTHPRFATADGAGAVNPLFQDPRAFLEDVARRPRPLPSGPPDTELRDPDPPFAGDIVRILADATLLEGEERDSVRLGTIAVVTNARTHGHPPVVVRVWARPDRVVVAVSDGGPGAEDLLAGVLPDGRSEDASRSLYNVREAVSEVSLFRGPDGFTVRLVQCRR